MSRHVSPDKLKMLLGKLVLKGPELASVGFSSLNATDSLSCSSISGTAANPASIREVTNDQKTALQLARTTATRSHPNYALIRALQEALPEGGDGVGIPSNAAAIVPTRVSSNDSAESNEEKTTKKRKAKGKHGATKTPRKRKRSGVKREITGLGTIETPVAADLLLHFSRGGGTATESKPGEVNARATQVAEV